MRLTLAELELTLGKSGPPKQALGNVAWMALLGLQAGSLHEPQCLGSLLSEVLGWGRGQWLGHSIGLVRFRAP